RLQAKLQLLHSNRMKPAGKLAGKVLVAVGGTTGLGLSAARAFVETGAQVVVVGRNPERAAEAKQILGSAGLAVAGDATDPATVDQAIKRVLEEFGAFHGLYHVAGGSGRKLGDGPLHEITDDGWDYTLKSNLTSLFHSNRAALRQFLRQKTGGS